MASTEQKILAEEREILKEEKEILSAVRAERTDLKKIERRLLTFYIGLVVVLVAAVGGFWYWRYSTSRIGIDTAQVMAPLITLTPSAPGTLQDVLVRPGDTVLPDTVVARVDNELIKTTVGGLIVSTEQNIGKHFNPGEAVVTMIDPTSLRVVGQIAEDKGLADVRVGQPALFTVDAFGGREFYGTVDEISPTSHNSDIVFSISNNREEKNFDIKVRFNVASYPELKNGMSAKITILK